MAFLYCLGFLSFFLPWADLFTSLHSAYDIFAGDFSGPEFGFHRLGIALLGFIPLAGVMLSLKSFFRKHISWKTHACLGLLGCAVVAYFSQTTTFEIGFIVSAVVFLALTILSVFMTLQGAKSLK